MCDACSFLTMFELTVGEASPRITAGVAILHFIIPNALCLHFEFPLLLPQGISSTSLSLVILSSASASGAHLPFFCAVALP